VTSNVKKYFRAISGECFDLGSPNFEVRLVMMSR
jgi:hypothetical protein